jgi:tetratricopeptide (TPR) repeat protein
MRRLAEAFHTSGNSQQTEVHLATTLRLLGLPPIATPVDKLSVFTNMSPAQLAEASNTYALYCQYAYGEKDDDLYQMASMSAIGAGETAGSKPHIALGYAGMMISLQNQGELDKARGYYNKALELLDELKSSKQAGWLLTSMANIDMSTGQWAAARSHITEAYQIHSKHSDTFNMMLNGSTLSLLFRWQGQIERSTALMRKIRELAMELRSVPYVQRCVVGEAENLLLCGHNGDALELSERLEKEFKVHEDSHHSVSLRLRAMSAAALFRTGNKVKALTLARHALTHTRDPKYSLLESCSSIAEVFCRALLEGPGMVSSAADSDRRRKAVQAATKAVEQLQRLSTNVPVARARYLIWKGVLAFALMREERAKVLPRVRALLPFVRTRPVMFLTAASRPRRRSAVTRS